MVIEIEISLNVGCLIHDIDLRNSTRCFKGYEFCSQGNKNNFRSGTTLFDAYGLDITNDEE